jgi:hypothetical protein
MNPTNMVQIPPAPTLPTAIPGLQQTEPLRGTSVMVAAGTLIIDTLVSTGWLNLTPTTSTAILSFVNVAAPLVVWILGRSKVFSPATVQQISDLYVEAHRQVAGQLTAAQAHNAAVDTLSEALRQALYQPAPPSVPAQEEEEHPLGEGGS